MRCLDAPAILCWRTSVEETAFQISVIGSSRLVGVMCEGFGFLPPRVFVACCTSEILNGCTAMTTCLVAMNNYDGVWVLQLHKLPSNPAVHISVCVAWRAVGIPSNLLLIRVLLAWVVKRYEDLKGGCSRPYAIPYKQPSLSLFYATVLNLYLVNSCHDTFDINCSYRVTAVRIEPVEGHLDIITFSGETFTVDLALHPPHGGSSIVATIF